MSDKEKFLGRIRLKSKNHKVYGYNVNTKEFGTIEPENGKALLEDKILIVQALNLQNALRKMRKVYNIAIHMKDV